MSERILPAASASERSERGRYSPETIGGPARPPSGRTAGRLYLGHRDVRSPEAVSTATFEAISDWQATIVKNALGQRFRASVRVGLRRPWWMPGPLYRALLRSVVTESRWEQKR